MPPLQFNAADISGTPRVYRESGENSIGNDLPGSGDFKFQAGLRETTAVATSVVDQTYPHAEGSYAGGEQRPFGTYNPNVSQDGDYQAASGMFAPGSGLQVFTSLKFAQAEGSAVDEVDYPGYYDGQHLDASGISHTQYANPRPANVDPFLDGDV
jgi:hypothetical protein